MQILYRFGIFLFLLVACSTQTLQVGDELSQKGDWDGAGAAYQEALKKEPFNKELEAKLRKAKIRAAEQHFMQGRQWLKERKIPDALQEFQIALGLDPNKPEHHTALNDAWRLKSAREALLDAKQMESLGRVDEALGLYETAIELDPSLTQALEGITRVVRQRQNIQTIGGSTEPVTLRFQNTRLKQVFEILARTANIDILFDKDVRDDLVTIFTKDTPFNEALNLILTTNQLFAKRAGPDRLLVIPDTKQKREQYEDLQIRTFYLSNSKAKDMANLLRTILETKRVYVNEPLNTIVVRDEPGKILLAEQVILANDRQDAEVLFDVEVLEVNRTKSQELGLNFAKQAGFGIFPSGTTNFNTLPQTFLYQKLTDLGQDSFLFKFPGSLLLKFFKQESNAKTLSSPKLRILNNQKGSINVGDQVPILLSTTNVLPGQAATGAVPTTSTVTSIEFKDTGIKLTIEPTVHLNNSITLRLQIEVTRLGDKVILQADPLITQFRFGTRTADTALNIRDGETVILAGLIAEEDRSTRDAIPGVDDIPIVGDVLSNKKTDKITTEVMLVITPHILRKLNPPPLAQQTLWSGTAKRYTTKPLFPHGQSSFAPLDEQSSNGISGLMDTPGLLPNDLAINQEQEPLSEDVTESSQNKAEASHIQVLPVAASFSLGDQVALTLQGQNFPSTEQLSLVLSYDPAVLTFKQASGGTLWTEHRLPPNLTVSAAPTAGKLVMQMGQRGKPVQGNGTLASLIFEATGKGTSNIHIQNPGVPGAKTQHMPVMVQHGKVWVE